MVAAGIKPGEQRTEVGIIPEDWNVGTLGDSFNICNNLRLPISEFQRRKMQGPYPYYGPTGVQDYINEYRVDGKYALIGEDGDHFLKWRDQPMTLLVKGKFNVNNHAHLVKGTKNLTEWFYWYFAHRDISKYLTKQGAGRLKLNKKALKKIPCAIPSPSEQNTISNILTDADILIRKLDQLISKVSNIRLGTIQSLVTGKKRLSGFDKPWKEKNLEELGKFKGGNGFPLIYQGKTEGAFPFFKVSDMNNLGNEIFMKYSNNYISEVIRDEIGFFVFPAHTIVFAKIGAAIFLERKKILLRDSCLDNNMMGYIVDTSKTNLKFLYYVMHNIKLGKLVSTTALPSLKGQEIGQLSTFIPSDQEEQAAISQVLTDIDAELNELKKKREKHIMIKKGMIQQLSTGKIRVK